MYMGLALNKEQRIENEGTDYSMRQGRRKEKQFQFQVMRNGKIVEESEKGIVA